MAIRAIYGIEWCDKIDKVNDRRARDGSHHVRTFMGKDISCGGESCNLISLKSSKFKCGSEGGPCTGTKCDKFYSNKSDPCLLETGDYIYAKDSCVCSSTTDLFPPYFSNGAAKSGCPKCVGEGQVGCFERNQKTCQIKKVPCG